MGHKKKSNQVSSQTPDNPSIENPIIPAVGSGDGQTAGGPMNPFVEPKPVRGRFRWLRRIFRVFIILIVVLLILRILLWLSLARIINTTMTHYGLEARYERLTLSLLNGNAEIWHLVLIPTDTHIPLTDIEYCTADVSLMTLFTGRLVVPRLEIDGIDIDLTRAEDGSFPQTRSFLEVLRKSKDAARQAATPTAEPTAMPGKFDLTPPFRLDALRLQHVQVHFQDKSVTPSFETQFDLNIRLSDLRSEKRKTRFQVILSSPPVLDQFQIEGTGSSDGQELLAELTVALRGLHPVTVKEYLANLGVKSDARYLSFTWSGSARIQSHQLEIGSGGSEGQTSSVTEQTAGPSLPPSLQIHLESKDALLTIDGQDQFALETAVLDAELLSSGDIRVGKVQINRGAFHAWRRDTGFFSVGGFQFIGRPQGKTTVDSVSAGAADAGHAASDSTVVEKVPMAWSIEGIEATDLRVVFHDQIESPQSDYELDLKEVTIANGSSQSEGMTLAVRLCAPGIVENVLASGTVQLSSSQTRAALQLSGTGIRLDALKKQLNRLGLESLYKGGAFECQVNAAFSQPKGGPLEGSASITKIRLQDADELFSLKSFAVQGLKVDPHAGTTRIDQVEISGQRLTLGRDATGSLVALGFRLNRGSAQTGSDPSGPNPQAAQSVSKNADVTSKTELAPTQPAAKIEIGRLSWHDNELILIDQMVNPAKTFAMPDLGLEITNLVLGGQGDALPAALKVWLRSPGTIEHAEVTGTIALQPARLSFDLGISSEGVALAEMTPYLQALGIQSTLTEGSVAAKINAEIGWANQGLQCSGTVRDMSIKDGDVELAGLNQMEIAQFALADKGLRVERIAIEQPRLVLAREKTGTFSFVGLNTIPKQDLEKSSKIVKSDLKKSEPALPVHVGRLEVKDARVQWSDRAVEPSMSQALATDLTLTDFTLGVEAPPATIALTVKAPGMIQQATVSGQVQITPTKQGTDLKVQAAGIDAGSLSSYLPNGLEPVLRDGTFNARIVSDLTRHPEGGQRIHVTVSDLDFRGNSRPDPLLHFDSAELAVARLDPKAQHISIQQLSVQGLEAAVERKATGKMSLVGLDLGASKSVSAENPPETDKKPTVSGKVPRLAKRFPLVVLDRLSLQARKLTLQDNMRPASAPVVISDLQIDNDGGINILGEQPDANPPIKIQIQGRVEPVAESVRLKLELSPFIAQPHILADWDIAQIRGSGLVSVLPEVRSAIDANSLSDGRFTGNAELTLNLDRRDVTEFDFGKPFGLELFIKSLQFNDTQSNTILAGLEELRAIIPTLDTMNGNIHIKEIGMVKPQGIVLRQTDGLHVLGMVLRTSDPNAVVDANAVAVVPSSDGKDARISRVEGPSKQAKPFNLRVDQFMVNGVDFNFTDQTVDPPMNLPIKGLDVEVRGFATRGVQSKEPLRFNIVATAGEVSLPAKKRDSAAADDDPADGSSLSQGPTTMEKRLLFQEMTANGRLTLYPQPDGWVKAGLNGLELRNFKGIAQQKGLNLRDGALDSSVDLRFRQIQPMSVRSQLVFTDLSLTEPRDGFLAQLLALPVSLDTALFILTGADGSIHVPLSFKVDEQGVSREQMVQAAVGAGASVIANAIAGSPFRIAGTIGSLAGAEKEQVAGAEVHLVQYASGVTTLSEKQLSEVAVLTERLRREKDLSITVRHQLGGGDIQKADELINPSSAETRELLAALQKKRSELQRVREEVAAQTRVAFAMGSRNQIEAKSKRLQETESQLGYIERALDDLLETTRPGTEYAARRRTRDACIAISKARLETLFTFLAAEKIPNAAGRITMIPPRFTEAQDSAGGAISLTLSKNKAR